MNLSLLRAKCLVFICWREESFRKQPHKSYFQLLFTSSILEWSEEFLGLFWGLEASIFWDKPYCQASLGSHHFDSILTLSSSLLNSAFPPQCSPFVFSIFRTSVSLSLFSCSLLFPFRGTIARMQSILSRVWSGRGK